MTTTLALTALLAAALAALATTAVLTTRHHRRLDRLYAGADPAPSDPRTVPTAPQLWRTLLDDAPTARQDRLRRMIEASDAGHTCVASDHAGRLRRINGRDGRR